MGFLGEPSPWGFSPSAALLLPAIGTPPASRVAVQHGSGPAVTVQHGHHLVIVRPVH
jgi:hypothetical protein